MSHLLRKACLLLRENARAAWARSWLKMGAPDVTDRLIELVHEVGLRPKEISGEIAGSSNVCRLAKPKTVALRQQILLTGTDRRRLFGAGWHA